MLDFFRMTLPESHPRLAVSGLPILETLYARTTPLLVTPVIRRSWRSVQSSFSHTPTTPSKDGVSIWRSLSANVHHDRFRNSILHFGAGHRVGQAFVCLHAKRTYIECWLHEVIEHRSRNSKGYRNFAKIFSKIMAAIQASRPKLNGRPRRRGCVEQIKNPTLRSKFQTSRILSGWVVRTKRSKARFGPGKVSFCFWVKAQDRINDNER